MQVEEIMREYDLAEEDVMACIAYREEMARERHVDIMPDRAAGPLSRKRDPGSRYPLRLPPRPSLRAFPSFL